MLNKRKLQLALDKVVVTGVFNEEYGRQVLELINLSIFQKGLRRRFGEFEVEYILREQLLLDLLGAKVFRYDKAKTKAHSYLTNVMESSVADGLRKVMAFKYGNESIAFNSDVADMSINIRNDVNNVEELNLSKLSFKITGRKNKKITIIDL